VRGSDSIVSWVPSSRDLDGRTALFALSGQPFIGLELTVTNLPSDPARPQADGDDAHEAQLLVTLPASLRYSGVRALDSVVRTWDGAQWAGHLFFFLLLFFPSFLFFLSFFLFLVVMSPIMMFSDLYFSVLIWS
jgi:hypothetical protein